MVLVGIEMAPDVLPPSHSSPNVSPPSTRPPPVFTPNPAATPLAFAPPSQTLVPCSVSSLAAPFISRGRSMMEQWCVGSPSSSFLGGSPPSYHDVELSSSGVSCAGSSGPGGGGQVVAGKGPAPAMATGPSLASSSWAPRITLLRRDLPGRAVFSSGAVHPILVGWQSAESHGARRRRQRVARPPRRPIPADVIGKCFTASCQCTQQPNVA